MSSWHWIIILSLVASLSHALSLLPSNGVSVAVHLRLAADALLECGSCIVGAAALLGENGVLSEDPASLSNGGCALCNAGRDLQAACRMLYDSDDCEWEEAASAGFYPAAGNLQIAAASLHYCTIPLNVAGDKLDAASQITGCIVMAAAAADDLQDSGRSLVEAARLVRAYADEMQAGGKVEQAAGALTLEAAASLTEAGVTLEAFEVAIGRGRATG
jgi:hypothetical protein